MTSVVRELGRPPCPRDLLDPHALIAHHAHERGRSSFGTHQAPSPAGAVTRRKSHRRLCDSYPRPHDVVNTSPRSTTWLPRHESENRTGQLTSATQLDGRGRAPEDQKPDFSHTGTVSAAVRRPPDPPERHEPPGSCRSSAVKARVHVVRRNSSKRHAPSNLQGLGGAEGTCTPDPSMRTRLWLSASMARRG
jgi:hypothetical protein